MAKRDSHSQIALHSKIGIIFNLPVKSPRGEDVDYVSEAEVKDQAESVRDVLRGLDFECQLFPLGDNMISLVRALNSSRPDVLINLCEGAFGESHLEMNVPAVLELMGIPYTGSPPLALGLCQNKALAKDVLRANGIATPEYQVLSSFEEWKGGIEYPLFVKPLREDASLGISRKSFVRNESELKNQVDYIIGRYRQPALVEKYIDGRELNVAILGNKKAEVLPISEIVFEFEEEPKIVDYSAKWFKETEEYEKTKPVCPAILEKSIEGEVRRTALSSYELLLCRDYGRVDIRLKNGTPYVLEVNPNPDISLDAGVVRSLNAAGISFAEFIMRIVSFALERKY